MGVTDFCGTIADLDQFVDDSLLNCSTIYYFASGLLDFFLLSFYICAPLIQGEVVYSHILSMTSLL